MIVDSSALVALIYGEPDAPEIHSRLMASTGRTRISSATLFETQIVIDGRNDPVLSSQLDELVRIYGIEVEPLTESQAQIARAAYRDFGRGSGHAANLNFGDCFAYALAIDSGEPLLCKGDDFIHTGVRLA